MSYQSTTPNFDLPQWVYSDPPQMNDFNTAFANIDEKAIPNDEKGTANGVATLDGSGKLVQMPTAADVGAVSQAVYQLTPQNGWVVASAASACCLVVTGKLATLIARLKGPNTTISDATAIFTLPQGIVPQKYIDDVMSCGGNYDNVRAIQIGTDGRVVVFSGNYVTGPYSISTSFLIN